MTSTTARIAFVAPFGLGQKTTVWARTLPLARHLAQRGHVVSLVIPPWDTPGDAGKNWNDGGVEVVQVQIQGGVFPTIRRMLHYLGDFRPDIVHVVKPRAHAGLVQWWLWQRRRLETGERINPQSPVSSLRSPRPMILLDIDDWEQAWAPINRYAWPVARFLAWQEEWGIRHADGITAASRWLVERAQRYTPQTPVLYLPNGIQDSGYEIRDTNYESRVTNSGSRNTQSITRVLFYTRFVEVEPVWLGEFWRSLYERRPDVRLVVAGAPLHPGRERVYQEAVEQASPTAARQVEWLGFVRGDQQTELYSLATCAIFPALPVPLQQAKCSVRLATTLLNGVPVVASAVGEQAAYGADGAARLVDPAATPPQFAEAVVDLLARPAEQQAMITTARLHLNRNYLWAKLGDSLVSFYKQWL